MHVFTLPALTGLDSRTARFTLGARFEALPLRMQQPAETRMSAIILGDW